MTDTQQILKREGVEVFRGTENQIFEWILKSTPFSNYEAFTNQGFTVEQYDN